MRKALALALLLAGCVVHERVPPPPPARPPPPPAPAAPPPRAGDERQAVKIASDFARARGLEVQRYKAKLDRAGHWRVELRGDGRDRARVLVDGRTGRVLRAKLKDSDDWED